MKNIIVLLTLPLLLLSSPVVSVNEADKVASTTSAFDPASFMLMQGNIAQFLLYRAMNKIQGSGIKTQLAVGVVIAAVAQLSTWLPELSKRTLSYVFGDDKENRRQWLMSIREIKFDDATPLYELFFNEDSKREINAVMKRIEIAAARNQPLPSVLFYGPPGTGKTALGKSFVHLGFQTFILPSHILREEQMFREVITEIERRRGQKKQAVIVDDAEFFFHALGPLNVGVRSSARDELESSFRTFLGNDNADMTWVFTSNKVSDIENDTSGAIKRRLKNRVLVPLPDKATRTAFMKSLIASSRFRFDFSIEVAPDFFESTSLERFCNATENASQDEIKQYVDNAIFLARERIASKVLGMEDVLFFAKRSQLNEVWIKEQAAHELANELMILRRQVEVKELRKRLQDEELEKETTSKGRTQSSPQHGP